jgi:hypothetical protein
MFHLKWDLKLSNTCMNADFNLRKLHGHSQICSLHNFKEMEHIESADNNPYNLQYSIFLLQGPVACYNFCTWSLIYTHTYWMSEKEVHKLKGMINLLILNKNVILTFILYGTVTVLWLLEACEGSWKQSLLKTVHVTSSLLLWSSNCSILHIQRNACVERIMWPI